MGKPVAKDPGEPGGRAQRRSARAGECLRQGRHIGQGLVDIEDNDIRGSHVGSFTTVTERLVIRFPSPATHVTPAAAQREEKAPVGALLAAGRRTRCLPS